MKDGRFIGGVGAVIIDPNTDQFLLLKRAANKDFAPGVWECAAGRLHQGEGFEAALHREIHEELGVTVQLRALLGTTHFFRGPACPENELIGVVYLCELDHNTTLQLSHEHDEARWVTLVEARALLTAPDATTQWTLRVLEQSVQIDRQSWPQKDSFNVDLSPPRG